MQRFEYRVIPAPKKGKRAKGVKGPEARFAHALTETMNELAAEGWEYLRADTLPVEERSGIASKHTTFQTLLVFRRARAIAGLIEDHAEAPAITADADAEADKGEADASDDGKTSGSESRDTGTKDTGTKDTGTNGTGTKDPASKDPGSKDDGAEDAGTENTGNGKAKGAGEKSAGKTATGATKKAPGLRAGS